MSDRYNEDGFHKAKPVSIISSTREMCKYCFDVIIDELTGSKAKINKFDMDSSIKSPLFVTWEINKDGNYHLRGCIGSLAPQNINLALSQYAATSAFQDPRFRPISQSEVPSLRVAVSLLVQYEDCKDCEDWTPGVHGIIINFTHMSKKYSATYLPEVAAEQGWSQLDAIKSLVQKSGFQGELTNEMKNKIHCTRYQSSKQFLTYDAYKAMNYSNEKKYFTNELGSQNTGAWHPSCK